MDSVVAISIMGVVIIGQLIERFFYAKEMNKQLGKAQGALFARNINDYLAATQENKKYADTPSEPEDVELADMSDDEFDKHIEQINH